MYAQKYGRPSVALTDDALDLLHSHDWPGNVRELAHTLEAAVVCSERGVIDSVLLQPLVIPLRGPTTAHTAETPSGRYSFLGSAAEEYAQIQEALRICRGNKTLTARRLGMSRNTLLSKLRRIEVDKALSQIAMEQTPGEVQREGDAAQHARDSAQMNE
jgi:DNA-binding NtrC family response regulator